MAKGKITTKNHQCLGDPELQGYKDSKDTGKSRAEDMPFCYM
jgi:hypothetical protein